MIYLSSTLLWRCTCRDKVASLQVFLVSQTPSAFCSRRFELQPSFQNMGVVQKDIQVVQWIWPSCIHVLKRGKLLALLTAEHLAWSLGWVVVLPGDGSGLFLLLSQKIYPGKALEISHTSKNTCAFCRRGKSRFRSKITMYRAEKHLLSHLPCTKAKLCLEPAEALKKINKKIKKNWLAFIQSFQTTSALYKAV